MHRFKDSATGAEDACPGAWFDSHLVEGIRAFRGQFGFFRYSAFQQYAPVLERVAAAHMPVNVVLGSNVTDPLTYEDVMSIWGWMAGHEACHLTVVAYRDVLFHPKVAHVVRADGRGSAMVGSANLTSAALGANVEAWIEVFSGTPEDDGMLAEIVRATDWWHSADEGGVFQVNSSVDASRLLKEGILIRTAQRWTSSSSRATADAARGSRRRRWRPSSSPKEIVEAEGEQLDAGVDSMRVLRWCKQLSRSDALQTAGGTNPTGTLRLGRARHHIDQNTWFREQLFGTATWVSISRRGKDYEEAHIVFDVEFSGRDYGQQVLLVDHAPHREAGQNNVVTLIHWGPELGQWLRGNDQTDKWVVIERDDQGEYQLRIEDTAPIWAPSRSA